MTKLSSPIKYGISAAVIVGYCAGIGMVASNKYVQLHMFSLASSIMAARMDFYAAFILCSVLPIWLLYKASNSFKKLPRFVLRVITSIAVIIGDLILFRLGEYLTLAKENFIDPLFLYTRILATEDAVFLAIAAVVVYAGYRILKTLGYDWSSEAKEVAHTKTELLNRFAKYRRFGHFGLSGLNAITSLLVIAFLAFNLFAGFCHLRNDMAVKDKPNVIFILVDALRADHLGCYGYYRNTSPNIDQLADHATLFPEAISQAPWTIWSICSFMTSRYPESLGLGDRGEDLNSLSNKYTTLAEVLKNNGYATSAVVSNYLFGSKTNGVQGFSYLNESNDFKRDTSPSIVSLAEKWISKNKSKRFFLYLHYMDVHNPYIAHKGYDFSSKAYHGKYKNQLYLTDPGIYQQLEKPENLHQAEALYDSGIAYTDHYIGKLIAYLKKEKLYDNTIIVFLADHGEEFNDHGSFGHGHSVYHELIHVPLIVKMPNQERKTVVKGCFPLINLSPSLLESIGYARPSSMLGRAVELNGLRSAPDEDIFSATNAFGPLRTVIRYPYKYIMMLDSRKGQLFNIAEDPAERHDIANSAPKLAETLEGVILQHAKTLTTNDNADSEKVKMTDRERQGLRSLGYLQ